MKPKSKAEARGGFAAEAAETSNETKAETKTKKKRAPRTPKPKGEAKKYSFKGRGKMIARLVEKNDGSDAEILEAVKKEYPGSTASRIAEGIKKHRKKLKDAEKEEAKAEEQKAAA